MNHDYILEVSQKAYGNMLLPVGHSYTWHMMRRQTRDTVPGDLSGL